MRGYSFDGLEFLNAKGAITVGTITAIHCVKEKELFIVVSRELDRDMLIALDAQGGDALFPTYFPVLAGLLESISLAE